MRWLRRLLRVLLLLLLGLGALHLMTRAPKDHDLRLTTEPYQGIALHVVDHGYHSGIIVSTVSLRRAAVEIGRDDPAAAARLRWLAGLYPDAGWLEIGWGDAAFYRQTPGIADVDLWLGLKALAVPTDAVLQVVPGRGAPEAGFPASDTLRLDLSPVGLSGLAKRLAETIPRAVPDRPLGASLYGAGAFFPAELDYHLLRTCNHWVAWLLRGAGAPASPVPGTFSTTLMAELRWRAPQ